METPLVRVTMAHGQTTGFVESLLRLIDLDWVVPNFSTLSRRQKTLNVNIPYRGSQGPRPLLIDIEPVSAPGSREPARGHQGRGRREVERPQAWRHEAARSPSPVGFGPMAPPLATPRTKDGQGSRRKIHIRCPAGEWDIRREGELTRKRWKSGLQISPEIRAADLTTSDVGDVEPVSATGSSEPARNGA